MSEQERRDQGLEPGESPTTGDEPPRAGEGGHEQTHGTVVDEDAADVVRERADEAD